MDAHDILIRPVVTEKAVFQTQSKAARQAYAFVVAVDANKIQIRRAVEQVFKVKVAGVRTIRMKGKPRRVRFRRGHRADWKKAMVTLREGYRIDII